jgi:hypothetical protein
MAEKDLDDEMETRIWNQFVRRGSETATLGKSENSAAAKKSRFTSSTQEGSRVNLIDNSKLADTFDYYNISDKDGKNGLKSIHATNSTANTSTGKVDTRSVSSAATLK